MSLLTERATRLDMLVYKHAAPPEQRQVSQIYDYYENGSEFWMMLNPNLKGWENEMKHF